MKAGDRVRRTSTGEDGVILSADTGTVLQVAFPSGTVLVHADELSDVPEGPTRRLALGQIGHAEPYSLRLQALYLKHAYRYDPLTCLSNARIEPQLHQVYVAHRVTQKLQPRMILADEVVRTSGACATWRTGSATAFAPGSRSTPGSSGSAIG
jgi:hypothetical protein